VVLNGTSDKATNATATNSTSGFSVPDFDALVRPNITMEDIQSIDPQEQARKISQASKQLLESMISPFNAAHDCPPPLVKKRVPIPCIRPGACRFADAYGAGGVEMNRIRAEYNAVEGERYGGSVDFFGGRSGTGDEVGGGALLQVGVEAEVDHLQHQKKIQKDTAQNSETLVSRMWRSMRRRIGEALAAVTRDDHGVDMNDPWTRRYVQLLQEELLQAQEEPAPLSERSAPLMIPSAPSQTSAFLQIAARPDGDTRGGTTTTKGSSAAAAFRRARKNRKNSRGARHRDGRRSITGAIGDGEGRSRHRRFWPRPSTFGFHPSQRPRKRLPSGAGFSPKTSIVLRRKHQTSTSIISMPSSKSSSKRKPRLQARKPRAKKTVKLRNDKDAVNLKQRRTRTGTQRLKGERTQSGTPKKDMYALKNGDVFSVQRLLTIAGVNLDRQRNVDGRIKRSAGTMLEVVVEYRNLYPYWSTFHPSPRDASIEYCYRVVERPVSEYKQEILPVHQPADYPKHRSVENQHGIFLAFRVGGSFGFLNFIYLLVMLTTSFLLLAGARAGLDFLALYLLPERMMYWDAKYETAEIHRVEVGAVAGEEEGVGAGGGVDGVGVGGEDVDAGGGGRGEDAVAGVARQ